MACHDVPGDATASRCQGLPSRLVSAGARAGPGTRREDGQEVSRRLPLCPERGVYLVKVMGPLESVLLFAPSIARTRHVWLPVARPVSVVCSVPTPYTSNSHSEYP